MRWQDHFTAVDRRLFLSQRGRKAIAARDPLSFALIYLRHHLRAEETDEITLADTHIDWSRLAVSLKKPTGLREWRHLFAAPRSMGKSTWWFLVIPMWLGAFKYRKFIAAFADGYDQAVGHLASFKQELDNNELLRMDFPDLVNPARRPNGTLEADRVDLYIAASRFAFAARGADSKLLGLKIGRQRPDMLILDDIEGDESTYSIEKSIKRLKTITDAILPLNERAAVVMTGTVTMDDSLIHQGVKHADSDGENTVEWLRKGRWQCHHYLPILTDDYGQERSCWPEKWPLEFLLSIRGDRDYAKNFLNMPLASDGKYWLPEHIRYGRLDVTNIRVLSIDPHVSRGKTSDYTGMAVVRYSTPYDMFDVPWALQTKLRGKELQKLARHIVEKYDITAILLETNQGGDIWTDTDHVFDPAAYPCRVTVVHQKESKEIRAARSVAEYECDRVLHWDKIEALETQMMAFPAVRHDDLCDALSSAMIEIRERVGIGRKQVHSPAVQAKWGVSRGI